MYCLTVSQLTEKRGGAWYSLGMDTQQRQLVTDMAGKLPTYAQMTHMYPPHCTRSEVISLHILQTNTGDGVVFVREIAQLLDIHQDLYTLSIQYASGLFTINCRLIKEVGGTKFVISVRGQMSTCPPINGFTIDPVYVNGFGWQIDMTSQELASY